MPLFEFGIDRIVRCYVTVQHDDEDAALAYLKQCVESGEYIHLLDDGEGRFSEYTDTADDSPRFDVDSIDCIDERDDEDSEYCGECGVTHSGECKPVEGAE